MKNIQDIIKKAAKRYGLNYNEKGTTPTVVNRDGTKKILSADFINEILELDEFDAKYKLKKTSDKLDNASGYKQKIVFAIEESKEYSKLDLLVS